MMFYIKVPATSANIGPGFDCLGVALTLFNTYKFTLIESGLKITGCPEIYQNENHLVYTSFKKVFELANESIPGIEIDMSCEIPISRGLGSSAACIVAGVKAANNFLEHPFTEKNLLKIAVSIEGHPDNIVPAFYGGFWASAYEHKELICQPIPYTNDLNWIAFVPNDPLSTEAARNALPKSISVKDAVFNLSNLAQLILAFGNKRYDLLKSVTQDKLHEPYRLPLLPHYNDIKNSAYKHGAKAVFLSGAGPTIMVLAENNPKIIIEKLPSNNGTWHTLKIFK
jgi:homoserine kinase